MKKEFCKIPSARLQRMKLSLLKYDLNLKYVPGKFLYVADLLSRYFNKNDTSVEIDDLNEFVHSVNITDERLEKLKSSLNSDKCLVELKQIVVNGWPTLSNDLKVYWKNHNNIYIDNDLLYLNERVIVPQEQRQEVLSQLHSAHLGIEKTKKRARSLVYWPQINKDIENIIEKCNTCQKHRFGNTKEPMIPHRVPPMPFCKIGMDICEYASKSYLIVSDYYSRFLDIIPITCKTANECIKHLKVCFSNHGIPIEIVSDNMPFNSNEFRSFCKRMGTRLTTTSPHYPQANGFSERFVGIAKNLIKKTAETKGDLWLALLEYRNTPLKELNASPVELLMSRKTRTLLPTNSNLLQPKIIPNVDISIKRKQQKSKRYYDNNAKFREGFSEGDKIWYRDKNGWIEAIIVGAHGSPRSYWIELEDGTILRRNSKWIRKRK